MAVGTAGIIIPPPPTMPDDVIGLLRLVANPEHAQRLLDHQQSWEDAHAANAEQLARMTKIKDLDNAKARVAAKEAQVDEALAGARAQASAMVEDASSRAAAIVSEANTQREGLAEQQQALDRLKAELLERAAAIEEAEADVAARRAEVNALHAKAKAEWQTGKEYAARAKKMLEVG